MGQEDKSPLIQRLAGDYHIHVLNYVTLPKITKTSKNFFISGNKKKRVKYAK